MSYEKEEKRRKKEKERGGKEGRKKMIALRLFDWSWLLIAVFKEVQMEHQHLKEDCVC
jgi:hypothetical protein